MIVKIEYFGKEQPVKQSGLKKSEKLTDGKLITLKSDDLDAENTLENPFLIVPEEKDVSVEGNVLESHIEPYSFYIYKFVLSR